MKENHCEEETCLFLLCESELIKHQTEQRLAAEPARNESDEASFPGS